MSWPLASPPSLSACTSLLSFQLPSPSCCSRRKPERQMGEKERAGEEGGRPGLAAGEPRDSRQTTEGPSASCPAHASLKTSVAIDNSCRAATQSHWLGGFVADAPYCEWSMLGRVVRFSGWPGCFKSKFPVSTGVSVCRNAQCYRSEQRQQFI